MTSKSTQHQLANIFARDPALAGNLLKVANSPVYRVSEDPVESLDRAVAMLGTDGLHSLIATALVQPVFKLAATSLSALSRRSSGSTPSARRAPRRTTPRRWKMAIRSRPSCWRSPWDWAPSSSIASSSTAARPCWMDAPPHPAVIISLIDSQCAGVAKRVAASWELSERVLTALEEQRPRRADQRRAATLAARALARLRSQARGAGGAARARQDLRRHGPRFDGPGRHRRRNSSTASGSNSSGTTSGRNV